jgi:3-hydroxybutyryl-CoA dehydrogenase
MEIKKVAVIGAGVMGCGIGLDLAGNNFKVVLKDISDEALIQAKQRIANEFRMVKMMKKEFKVADLDEIYANITFTTDYDEIGKVDLIIENITEDWELKKNVYLELKNVYDEATLLAANTSCISITKIASLVKKAEKVIGLHFMNPVPLKPMVETVKGYHTSQETVDTILGFLRQAGKKPVVVADLPGFVANRLSHLFMNEAAFLVQDGVAAPADIDEIFKQGYGHKMGPLETADLIGLDTVVNSLDILYSEYQDTKFRCCPLLKKMVHAGLNGRKSGKGFYEYELL